MTDPPVQERILEQVNRLGPDAQLQVLEFARTLASDRPRGEPGKHLLKLIGCIPQDDLKEIEEAIQKGCEQVDPNGW